MLPIAIPEHPLLDLAAFVTQFPDELSSLEASEELISLFGIDADAPLQSSDEVRLAVRNLLRQGGFKPTGRSKPASEYLIKAAANEALGTINVAVDACNAVSLNSGLPISVVDLDLGNQPFHVAIAPTGTNYVFNQSGQTIDLGGLLCLYDNDGPCANAVKDSQRTKTRPQTRQTLTVIWGTNQLPGRTAQTQQWYCSLLTAHGAATSLL